VSNLTRACAAVAVLALAGCGGSSTRGATGSTARGAAAPPPANAGPLIVTRPGFVSTEAGGARATLHAGTHRPRATARWPIVLSASDRGAPADARVEYEFVLAGQVVARRSHYRFHGRFADQLEWPPESVGYPLTFRAAVSVAGVTLNLDYPVQVQR
jgi:hypothetical protein